MNSGRLLRSQRLQWFGSLNGARAQDLPQAPGTLGGRLCQGFLPDALVIDDALAQALDPDLVVGEGLSPEIDPHVVDEKEDQLMMVALERHIGGQAMGELVDQRSALGLGWIAGPQEHRSPTSVAGVARAFVDPHLDGS